MASATYLWSKILTKIEQVHSPATVETFFRDVDVVSLLGDTLYLYSDNDYARAVIESSAVSYITDAAYETAGLKLQVIILDRDGLQKFQSRDRSDTDLEAIGSSFTFDNFVVGSSNRFAHAAAQAVSDHPAEAYNPLLIYGESGLGKTHLLYAIAGSIREKHPEYSIVYVKGDQFTNELIDAIKAGKNTEFRSKYRTADLFLMDDIQFIAGREQTQEEFFHTFNTLFEAKKQIVLTSDRAPDAMNKLEDRLKTRFQWGLLADIQAPDYETRVAIIERKADILGLELPREVVSYVAENITNNVRQLEGTVNKIKAYRDINGDALTITNVSRAIRDMFREEQDVLPTPQLIINQVAAYYNQTESSIRGTSRNKNIVEARQISMYLIRNLTNLSYEDIAVEFGKDHTTVMHSVEKIENMIQASPYHQTVIQEITSNINGRL